MRSEARCQRRIVLEAHKFESESFGIFFPMLVALSSERCFDSFWWKESGSPLAPRTARKDTKRPSFTS